jgi:hypothetical protein
MKLNAFLLEVRKIVREEIQMQMDQIQKKTSKEIVNAIVEALNSQPKNKTSLRESSPTINKNPIANKKRHVDDMIPDVLPIKKKNVKNTMALSKNLPNSIFEEIVNDMQNGVVPPIGSDMVDNMESLNGNSVLDEVDGTDFDMDSIIERSRLVLEQSQSRSDR